jgi:2-oxoacid:acceptor oxidoreductase delta subunit (pyruvate/2-ketoisovalerate family)
MMALQKRSESAKTFAFRSWRDITALQASLGTMLHNKTGSWRFIKPIYEDKVPACQNACPVGNDIEGWVKLLGRKAYAEAYWHLKREEPFPAVLGRVCFKFCESACNRAALDDCVGIREMERFIADQVPAAAVHPLLPADNGKRLAVVGSGPAGMSAAYFARLLGFGVTMFEKADRLGGLLATGIPAYRLPREVVAAQFEGLAAMGVDLKPNFEIGRDAALEDLAKTFDYIFLASGAHRSISLGLGANARSPQVMSGLALLEKVAWGESASLGRRVVVVGGGNTAIDAARTVVRLGCAVTVIYRRSEAEMPAHPEEVREAREEGVVFKFLAAPEKILFDDGGIIAGLVCREMRLGKADESGRRRPVPKEHATFEVAADTIVTAIGETPDLTYLGTLMDPQAASVYVDAARCFQVAAKTRARIYAGGDATDTPRTVVHAVASGKRAAVAMDCDRKGLDPADELKKIAVGNAGAVSFAKYMGWPPVNPVRRNDADVVDARRIVYDYFTRMAPTDKKARSGDDRRRSFEPYLETFSKEDAQRETLRCMHCGRCTQCDNCLIFCPDVSILDHTRSTFGYAVDYDYCKGCGICATECPRSAITMLSEAAPVEAGPGKEA